MKPRLGVWQDSRKYEKKIMLMTHTINFQGCVDLREDQSVNNRSDQEAHVR